MNDQQEVCTFGFLVEAIPLHLATTHITADKVSAIAQEHSVTYCVDVWRREVCNAGVAGVLTICRLPGSNQLLPNLQSIQTTITTLQLMVLA